MVFDYDMKIAEPFRGSRAAGARSRCGPRSRALAGRPVLVVRGDLSDILSAEDADEMEQQVAGLDAVTRPARRPHADARGARGARRRSPGCWTRSRDHRAPRLLHLHSSFDPGGKELRCRRS